eukprot:TRINITY_DN4569_c0_g1_i2.p1 TRINITY_DN4569_c0_g1~~TRINITY_DN4569_c0_g1_i2.p1  ORF type:complete len:554 (-),score=117.14 TRINITY_DN4569_c0_g1_i2:245-1906(-)
MLDVLSYFKAAEARFSAPFCCAEKREEGPKPSQPRRAPGSTAAVVGGNPAGEGTQGDHSALFPAPVQQQLDGASAPIHDDLADTVLMPRTEGMMTRLTSKFAASSPPTASLQSPRGTSKSPRNKIDPGIAAFMTPRTPATARDGPRAEALYSVDPSRLNALDSHYKAEDPESEEEVLEEELKDDLALQQERTELEECENDILLDDTRRRLRQILRTDARRNTCGDVDTYYIEKQQEGLEGLAGQLRNKAEEGEHYIKQLHAAHKAGQTGDKVVREAGHHAAHHGSHAHHAAHHGSHGGGHHLEARSTGKPAAQASSAPQNRSPRLEEGGNGRRAKAKAHAYSPWANLGAEARGDADMSKIFSELEEDDDDNILDDQPEKKYANKNITMAIQWMKAQMNQDSQAPPYETSIEKGERERMENRAMQGTPMTETTYQRRMKAEIARYENYMNGRLDKLQVPTGQGGVDAPNTLSASDIVKHNLGNYHASTIESDICYPFPHRAPESATTMSMEMRGKFENYRQVLLNPDVDNLWPGRHDAKATSRRGVNVGERALV